MDNASRANLIAFFGTSRVAEGNLLEVAHKTKEYLQKMEASQTLEPLLIFDEQTSAQVEVDFRGTVIEVLNRIKDQSPARPTKPTGPGRPKLGVVSREIGLLPAHWDWLATQPGGASVTLRKLVDAAKKSNKGQDQIRAAQNSTYKFATVMAGNLPSFEEALRALFAKDKMSFEKLIEAWPKDIQDHLKKISTAAFQ